MFATKKKLLLMLAEIKFLVKISVKKGLKSMDIKISMHKYFNTIDNLLSILSPKMYSSNARAFTYKIFLHIIFSFWIRNMWIYI